MRTSDSAMRLHSPTYSAAGSTLPGGLTSSLAPAVTSHDQQASSWQRKCAERPWVIGDAGECLIEYEQRSDPHSFRIPRGLRDSPGLHGVSGSLQTNVRHLGSHQRSNVLYERGEGLTAAQGLGDPHEFHKSRELHNQRISDSQSLCNPRGLSNPYAIHESQGLCHPQRISSSHKFHDPQRLRDPREFHRSSGSDGGRRRADRLSGQRDNIHRPYSNLAVTVDPAVSDITSKDQQAGRSTSMSVGSIDSVQRPPVKFASLPNVDEMERQTSAGSDVSEPWNSAFESRCLDRPSTFVSMPCISSHQRHGAGRGLTPKRFLPTLSISEEASTGTSS